MNKGKVILELPSTVKLADIRRFLIEHGLVFHEIVPGDDTRIVCTEKWAPRLVEQFNAEKVGG